MTYVLRAHQLHPFSGMDIPGLLEQRAQTRRDHPFLIWAPFDGPGQSWSYGRFLERVRRIAGGLQRRGVGEEAPDAGKNGQGAVARHGAGGLTGSALLRLDRPALPSLPYAP